MKKLSVKQALFIFIAFIFIVMCSSSCVSTRPANTVNKAENRLIKYKEGIDNQISKFPQLSQNAFTKIVKEEYIIPPDSAYIKKILFDLDSINNNTNKLSKLLYSRELEIDSLLNVPLGNIPEECKEVVSKLQTNNKLAIEKVREQRLQALHWFEMYNRLLTTTIEGTYQDGTFVVNYKYENGNIIIEPKVNERKIVVDKQESVYDISVRKNFWQDFKFYPFLIVLTSIFYFFGEQIFAFIKKAISLLLTLLRKLLLKI